jgi:hypothetical protein
MPKRALLGTVHFSQPWGNDRRGIGDIGRVFVFSGISGGWMKKRGLFEELMQGIDEMAAQREGKITLRDNAVEDTPIMDVDTQKKCSVAGDVAYIPKQ